MMVWAVRIFVILAWLLIFLTWGETTNPDYSGIETTVRIVGAGIASFFCLTFFEIGRKISK